jgi:hypothetical protein
MASDVERAWTAGIMDGDGCVTMKGPGMARISTIRRRPLVVVDSTDIEILHELQRLYGGSLVKKRKSQDHHRQAWSWRLYGATIILSFLQDLLPYMRCEAKRSRAQLLVDEYKLVTPRNGRYTPDVLQRRIALEERFMAIGAGRGSQNRSDNHDGGR